MLANSAIGVPILSWKICYAAYEVGALHVNCGSVRQVDKRWLVLRVPKRGGASIDGERPAVVGSRVCAIYSDRPARLGDGRRNNLRGRRGRRNRSERNAIIGCTAFGGEFPLGCCRDGLCSSVGSLSRDGLGVGEGREGGEGEDNGCEESKHLESVGCSGRRTIRLVL